MRCDIFPDAAGRFALIERIGADHFDIISHKFFYQLRIHLPQGFLGIHHDIFNMTQIKAPVMRLIIFGSRLLQVLRNDRILPLL